ncbi:hypothetical protein [Brachybacterium epidermidis]|uniref:hypothetical protein n=1 Tax=Brachybacterium epidermidis TaxID=2781983 RepID=UPI00398E38C4
MSAPSEPAGGAADMGGPCTRGSAADGATGHCSQESENHLEGTTRIGSIRCLVLLLGVLPKQERLRVDVLPGHPGMPGDVGP